MNPFLRPQSATPDELKIIIAALIVAAVIPFLALALDYLKGLL